LDDRTRLPRTGPRKPAATFIVMRWTHHLLILT
jgi:hypothetical protein